ncbi:MAG: WG repeat-containing protein [Saprospiraceae bacterium]|nr:WG repeat-containing protein [Saprospiraceae bacterium]
MTKRLAFLFLIFLSFNSVSNAQALFPIIDSTCHFGFINKKGEIVIEPNFDCVFDFNEGFAPVFIDNKWGYIDTNGVMVIENIYKKALNFSDGLALVIKDSLVGYINKDGKTIIPFIYEDGLSFSEGLAAVFIDEKGWGYIGENNKFNKRLNRKLDFNWYEVECGDDNCPSYMDFFNSGLIPYYDGRDYYDKIFIDRKGKKHSFSKDVYSFYDGLADFKENNRYGFIDTKNNVIIPAKYYKVSNFNNGLAWVIDSLINSDFLLLLIDKNDSIYNSIELGKRQAIFIINNENSICNIYFKNSDSIAYVSPKGDILFVEHKRNNFKNMDLCNSLCRKFNNDPRNPWICKWHDSLIPIDIDGVLKYVDIKGNVIWEGGKATKN